MTHRLSEIDIPPNNPFANDALGRKESVNFMANLIEVTPGPFVFAIDSEWGTGKTTFVKMLMATLEAKNFHCVYLDAWKFDYLVDPITAMVSVLDDLTVRKGSLASEFRSKINKLGDVANYMTRRSAIAAVKVVTNGAVDLDLESEALARSRDDSSKQEFLDTFKSEIEKIGVFRRLLEDAVEESGEDENAKPLIFFVDELDRCRPSFSISLLERIKHLFDVKNIVFVLSIDKDQLISSTRSIYGAGIDAPAYLRKFIDLEFGIPEPRSDAHTSYLISKFELESLFRDRSGDHAFDQRNFVRTFSQIASLLKLTLRDRELCLLRLKIVLNQTYSNDFLDPVFLAMLIILRLVREEIFLRICANEISASEVMSIFRDYPGGEAFIESNTGLLLEAYLIASEDSPEKREASISSLRSQIVGQEPTNHIRVRAETILNNIQLIFVGRNGFMSKNALLSRIDMAARTQ